jgi:16S rRNA G1207 methylase RsmC
LEQCSSLKAQVILCNPPFHQQQILSDHIAWQMFTDAFKALHTYGELRVVANRHLGYHEKLKRLFGGAKVIASNAKFVILSAIKHPK